MNRRDLLRALGVGAVAGTGLDGLARSALRDPAIAARLRSSQAFIPDVELTLTAAPAQVSVLPGAPTDVWRFSATLEKGPADTLQPLTDSYLGPVLRFRRGQRVRIRFNNRVPERTIVHWHGLDVPEAADGHPHLAIDDGATYTYEFEVRNRAGTYWYHPHPHGRTGIQVYRGLGGVIVVTDDEEAAAGLPSGAEDVVCVLQDRLFTPENQFVYPGDMMTQRHGFLGGRMLVNGRPDARMPVGTRAYRLRLLNASSSRVYRLVWSDGSPMTVIGGDGGLLERPIRRAAVTLAPSQRVDVILDLSGRAVGSSVELRSAEFPRAEIDPAGGGMGGGMRGGMAGAAGGPAPLGAPMTLMTFDVVRRESVRFALPERLSTYDASWSAAPTLQPRRVELSFAAGQWLLGGRTFDMMTADPDETVPAGASQVWEVVNVGGMMGTPMAHPLHIHGPQFRVLSRSRPSGAPVPLTADGLVDDGWTDTVLVLPNETVRLHVHFTRHPGLYLYHCHILEHEDLGMMRNFRVV